MTEKDIEDLIMGALTNERDCAEMQKRGFPIFQIGRAEFYRQVRIKNHGIADIVAVGFGRNKNGDTVPSITVYELKLNAIGASDIEQVTRYASALVEGIFLEFREHYSNLSGKFIEDPDWDDVDVNMVLIGSSCDFQANGALTGQAPLKFYTYHVDALKGITFEEDGHLSLGFESASCTNWLSPDFSQGLDRLMKAFSLHYKTGMPFFAETDSEHTNTH